MSTLVSELILEVSNDLFDQDSYAPYARWDKSDLLSYLNEARLTTAFFKPESNENPMVYQLAAGSRQNLPDGSTVDPDGAVLPKAIELVRPVRNMGADGKTPGDSIYPVGPNDMDDVLPGWRSENPAATVQHVIIDPKDRRHFDCFPPQPTVNRGWIEIQCSAVPNAIVVSDSNYAISINFAEEYVAALKAYTTFKAYARDSKSSQFALQRAMQAWNFYLTLIGRKDLVEKKFSPPVEPAKVPPAQVA